MSLRSYKTCLMFGAALALSACSYSGSDRYASYDSYSDYSGGEAAGYYGGGQGADCAAGMAGTGGSGRYGLSGGYSDGSGVNLRKSRYGSESYYEEYAGYSGGGAMGGCGYWMIPTYHIIETPAAPAPVTTTTTVTETTCADGQYKMADGTCAVMMTEEPEIPQYTPPPVISYPEPPSTPIDYYQPIRK